MDNSRKKEHILEVVRKNFTKLNKTDFAKSINFSKSQYSNYINNNVEIGEITISRVKQVYNVDLNKEINPPQIVLGEKELNPTGDKGINEPKKENDMNSNPSQILQEIEVLARLLREKQAEYDKVSSKQTEHIFPLKKVQQN